MFFHPKLAQYERVFYTTAMKRRNFPSTMLVAIVLASLLIATVTGCATSGVSGTGSIPAALVPSEIDTPRIADFKFFCTELPKRHRDLFSQTPSETYYRTCERLLPAVEHMTETEFFFALRELAALAGDSHTMVGMSPRILAEIKAIPVQLQSMDGVWTIMVAEASNADILGATVLTVNGIPMEEVVAGASKLVSHDNETWMRLQVAQLLNIVDTYVYLGIAENGDEDLRMTVVRHHGELPEEVRFTPIPQEEFHELDMASWVSTLPPTGQSSDLYRALTIADDVLFVQYNACRSWDAMPIEVFTARVLDFIKEQRPKKIIVDLRYNGGGDSRLFEPMIDGLREQQRQQGFSIDVLIGEGTFSSALLNAIQLKRRTDSRLVGTPTGGSANHFGEVKYLVLPNSGIRATYSTKFFTMDGTSKGGSLEPDIIAKTNLEDLAAGIDTQVAAALLDK